MELHMYYDLKESGKRIAELRKEKGYTQAALADMLGMASKSIAAIETGARGTSIDTLVALAEVLDTTLDYIIVGRKNNVEMESVLAGVEADKQELALKILKGILQSI